MQRLWTVSVQRRWAVVYAHRVLTLTRSVRCSVRTASESSNRQMNFPCLDKMDSRTSSLLSRDTLRSSGPEPLYAPFEKSATAYSTFHDHKPLLLDYGGVLSCYDVAYESWGTLNLEKSNAVLLHTGLSASSHAKSHEHNKLLGWWEKFIGPGRALDTDRYFVICTNVLGGCYGSTGPGSIDPADGKPYATRFPVVSIWDMLRAQFNLLDHLGIQRLHASVGSSMGGMQSLALGILGGRERVDRIASISGCARSHPYSIALRHTQRQIIMADPHWRRGYYYDHVPPHHGMRLARVLATITYRSGPEWETRFGRRRADPSQPPALCPDFLIETYLDHAGDKWCLEYDANSMLYISKAMDLFDLSHKAQVEIGKRRKRYEERSNSREHKASNSFPDVPYEEQPLLCEAISPESEFEDLVNGFANLIDSKVLVIGVASDLLFPAKQQREIVSCLRAAGNKTTRYMELSEEESLYGHDSFLLLDKPIGDEIQRFLNE